jgi:hypothetical protein
VQLSDLLSHAAGARAGTGAVVSRYPEENVQSDAEPPISAPLMRETAEVSRRLPIFSPCSL